MNWRRIAFLTAGYLPNMFSGWYLWGFDGVVALSLAFFCGSAFEVAYQAHMIAKRKRRT